MLKYFVSRDVDSLNYERDTTKVQTVFLSGMKEKSLIKS